MCVVFDLNMIQSRLELAVSAPMAADDGLDFVGDELHFCAPMPAADEFGKPIAADDELDFSAPMAADTLACIGFV